MTTRIPSDQELTARLAAVRTRLLETVATVRPVRFSRGARIGFAAAAGIVLAAGLTGGTIVVIQATQEVITYSVQCYEGASLSSDFITVGHSEATEGPIREVTPVPTDPVETCTDVWRRGLIGQETPLSDPNTPDLPAPEIVGCTLTDGIGAGFPIEDSTATAEDFCRSLGLAPWED